MWGGDWSQLRLQMAKFWGTTSVSKTEKEKMTMTLHRKLILIWINKLTFWWGIRYCQSLQTGFQSFALSSDLPMLLKLVSLMSQKHLKLLPIGFCFHSMSAGLGKVALCSRCPWGPGAVCFTGHLSRVLKECPCVCGGVAFCCNWASLLWALHWEGLPLVPIGCEALTLMLIGCENWPWPQWRSCCA